MSNSEIKMVTIPETEYRRLIALEGIVNQFVKTVSAMPVESAKKTAPDKPVKKMTRAQMEKHFREKLNIWPQ